MIRRALLTTIVTTIVAVGFQDLISTAQSLLERTIQVGAEAEGILELAAASPGASWAVKGKEAATATIFLDGRYHQDLILFKGSESSVYSVLLGRLTPGTHSLRIEHNRKLSAPQAASPEFKDAKVSLLERSQHEFQALALAPILYARPNTIGRFSDVPLLAWYEVVHESMQILIRYSVIFTNEDGGTQTNALMARWGRTTDIELIYEARLDAQGNLLTAIFQGKDHKNLPFRGRKEADHPLFLVSTDNNMFSDKGQSEMRFALRPILFDLSKASREEVMNQNPWTYQLMAQELKREDKINEAYCVGPKIADLRRYVYIQAGGMLQGTALSFAAKLKGDRKWYTSDIGIAYYKIDRNGYFQTTIRLPAAATLDQIEGLAVRCDIAGDPRSKDAASKLANAGCELAAVNRIFMLDENYRPGPQLQLQIQPLKLQFGDMIELRKD